MGLSNRLKERREQLGLTQGEVASLLGITPGAVGNYENAVSTPKADVLFKVFDALKCDANYLFQDEMSNRSPEDAATPLEMENLVKKYRALDDTGRTNVDVALERETDRVRVLKDLTADYYLNGHLIETIKSDFHTSARRFQTYAYFYLQKIACAGSSFTFNEIPSDTINAPFVDGADFVIGIKGNSMEPDFHDGDKVYVQKTNSLSIGDVGIFTINDTCFIKELGEDGLISHNKNYEDIPETENVHLIGKVIDKVNTI
jgi:SOS-response transcriptional repressor LexA